VTTHLEKSGNSKVVGEKSGEVKSAEIWLFVQLKYQYHKAVVNISDVLTFEMFTFLCSTNPHLLPRDAL